MSRYPLKLPRQLKHEAEAWATREGVSLNQFLVWAVAEKIGGLNQRLHDPRFPHIEYRIGASRWPTPILRGTGLRVQTLVVAHRVWGRSIEDLAADYELPRDRVEAALSFYEAHRAEIDRLIDADTKAAAEAQDSSPKSISG